MYVDDGTWITLEDTLDVNLYMFYTVGSAGNVTFDFAALWQPC